MYVKFLTPIDGFKFVFQIVESMPISSLTIKSCEPMQEFFLVQTLFLNDTLQTQHKLDSESSLLLPIEQPRTLTVEPLKVLSAAYI